MSVYLFNNGIRENDFYIETTEWSEKGWQTIEKKKADRGVFDRFEITVIENGKGYQVDCQVAPVKKRLKDDAYVRDFVTLMSYCRFSSDFSSPLTVRICPSFKYTRCELEPYCDFKDNGDCIELTLSEPTAVSIVFDGNRFENLFLFAESEEKAPDTSDKSVIYFGKGVHDASTITVGNDQTLYLEAGAYVYGNVILQGDNITVCGKGVLCGSKMEHDSEKPRQHLFAARHCKNLTIKDVMLIDSPTWTFSLYDCHNVVIDGIREICRNENSDGIDVCVSSEVEIKNIFLRNWDDNISFKARDYDGKDAFCGNALVKNCVFWADKAHNMIIGPEGTATAETLFDNIVFTDIKVLNSAELMFPQGCMCVLGADNSVIKNVTFKNIEVYHLQSGRLVNILYTDWFAHALGKQITNITFENINCYSSEPMLSRVFGESESKAVKNIRFIDYTINGKKQTEKDNTVSINRFAEVSFR